MKKKAARKAASSSTSLPTDRATLEAIQRCLKLLGEQLDDRMPIQQAILFLAVAIAHLQHGETEARELSRETGLSAASISRNIAALGEWHRLGRPGFGVLEQRTDYEDRRRRPVVLTNKGIRLTRELGDCIRTHI